MASAALIEVVHGAPARTVGIPREGLVVGRSAEEMRRVLGRLGDGSVLLVAQSSVSKIHARFVWQGDDLTVEDGYLDGKGERQRSRNRVLRRGQELVKAFVSDGDELVLGDVTLRVGISGARYGLGREDLPKTESTLKPAPPAESTITHERRAADMLPIVESLFQAVSFEDLGQRIARAVKTHLAPTRVGVLEVDPESDRLRVLGLAGAETATFISRTVVEEAMSRGMAFHRAGSSARPLGISMRTAGATSALAAVIRPRNQRLRVLYLDTTERDLALTWTAALEAQLIAAHAAAAFDAIETQRQIAEQRVRFEHLRRFFAPNVVEFLLKNPDATDVAQVNASVLFADLSGYTRLSERLSDDLPGLVALLNRWLDAASRIVFAHGGTLDKFIGDAVMAVFGAPLPMQDGPTAAVRCAVEMHEAVEQIARETGEDLKITVGINTGPMVAGSIGSQRRLEYTVLGDTVNVAARLQTSAERGETRIGQGTLDAIDGRLLEVAVIGDLAVKNREKPVKAYRIVRLAPP